jgi:hypothetical protein
MGTLMGGRSPGRSLLQGKQLQEERLLELVGIERGREGEGSKNFPLRSAFPCPSADRAPFRSSAAKKVR